MSINGKLEIEYVAKFWQESVKPPLMKAFELVPDDKLDWVPAKDMMSLGNIFLHIAECSEWWIGDVIDGKDSHERMSAPCPSKEKIAELLNEHWQRLDDFFTRTPEVLEKVYKYKGKEKTREFEGRWIMMHVLEHDIHHRCQANQYLRILGIAPPQI